MGEAADSILITGGAGFIGSRLAARLLSRGHQVTCLDNLHPQVHAEKRRPAALPSEVNLHIGDVTDAADCEHALKMARPDVIVHLAAETGTGQSLLESTRHASVNVVGTTQLLDASSRLDLIPNQVVLASSRAVYGEGRWITAGGHAFSPGPRTTTDLAAGRWDPLSPDGTKVDSLASSVIATPAQPTNVYASTKLAQEHIVGAWCAAMGPALSVLRLQNVYGPGQSLSNSYTGVVALFCRLAAEGRAIPVYEDGAIVRDFVYVDDVVAALVAAIGNPPPQRRNADIGSGRATTILEVAALLAERAGAPLPVVTGQYRAGDVRAASCELDVARQSLDWAPVWSLEDGLSSLLDWVRQQRAAS